MQLINLIRVFVSVMLLVLMAEAGSAAERKALFGELHMHTQWSFDAYLFNTRATPDDAYAYAKGKPLKHANGETYQITRPLDFMAVTDHARLLGVFARMADSEHPLSKLPIAKLAITEPPGEGVSAFFRALGESGDGIAEVSTPEMKRDAWDYVVASANRHYDPGKFTTFIGYEWTSTPNGQNLHRNVIFAGETAPPPFTASDSSDPEDLWVWMDTLREGGHQLLAIPHNVNLSDGRAFERQDSFDKPFTADYATTRNRNEPLVEVTQIKGTSETHPMLSPNDEFADFEINEIYVASTKAITNFAGSYVRDALKTGLEFQDTQSLNPYRFGLIGASDSHTGISAPLESNFSGPSGEWTGTPDRRLIVEPGASKSRYFGASGLAGVWADENTRAGVFGALQRKETWGTTGPRIRVRFFGGDLAGMDVDADDWVAVAYERGVPMGGELRAADIDASPTFAVWAIKDAAGANLDRIQIVKGWSEEGVSYERIVDAVWSGERRKDAATGKLPAVGNTVNLATLAYANSIGAAELKGTWTDPDFDSDQNSFYYVRVLEIPTPRWSTFDANALGIPPPPDLDTTIQERAYTSPIRYEKP